MFDEKMIRNIRFVISIITAILTLATIVLLVKSFQPFIHTILFGLLVLMNIVLWVLDLKLKDSKAMEEDRRNGIIWFLIQIVCIFNIWLSEK